MYFYLLRRKTIIIIIIIIIIVVVVVVVIIIIIIITVCSVPVFHKEDSENIKKNLLNSVVYTPSIAKPLSAVV